MERLIVIVPTYNEKENIVLLKEAIFALDLQGVEPVELLVIDDNSQDGTGRIVDEMAAADPRVHAMHRPGKMGLGTAYIQGFQWAIKNNYDLIIQMDADFSHDPKYIPQMLEAIQNADMVINSRYTKGGSLDKNWSVFRKLLSWWANRVWITTILRNPVKDSTGGFRLWRRNTLIGMDLRRIRSNGYIFQAEITYIALRLGYRVVERPIYFADRKRGKSKMGLNIQIEAALRVFQVWARHHSLTMADRATALIE